MFVRNDEEFDPSPSGRVATLPLRIGRDLVLHLDLKLNRKDGKFRLGLDCELEVDIRRPGGARLDDKLSAHRFASLDWETS